MRHFHGMQRLIGCLQAKGCTGITGHFFNHSAWILIASLANNNFSRLRNSWILNRIRLWCSVRICSVIRVVIQTCHTSQGRGQRVIRVAIWCLNNVTVTINIQCWISRRKRYLTTCHTNSRVKCDTATDLRCATNNQVSWLVISDIWHRKYLWRCIWWTCVIRVVINRVSCHGCWQSAVSRRTIRTHVNHITITTTS